MSTAMTLGLVLIGLAPVIVAWAAVAIPRGERLATLLALVAGAGAGVVTLAIEFRFVSDPTPNQDELFLLASAIGFIVTMVTLVMLVRVMRREANPAVP
jgi:Co/Zn/Cd efflux system component